MKKSKPNYSYDEVEALIEHYDVKYAFTKLSSLVRFWDLSVALYQLPPKEYQAVLTIGLIGLTLRDSSKMFDVSPSTMWRRYERGIEWTVNYLNGVNHKRR